MDYINNGREKESIIVSDDTNSYLFTMDIIEQYRYWTKTDKLNIDFSFFDETGNTIYCGVDTVNKKIIYYDDDVVNSDFEFTIFKPDIYLGQQTPAYFNRNLIVKEIEIMYTGSGKISVYNNSKDIPTVIVDELVFTDQFYKSFDGEVKISKSAIHLQWGDILKFKVETQGEFRIMAINLKS